MDASRSLFMTIFSNFWGCAVYDAAHGAGRYLSKELAFVVKVQGPAPQEAPVCRSMRSEVADVSSIKARSWRPIKLVIALLLQDCCHMRYYGCLNHSPSILLLSFKREDELNLPRFILKFAAILLFVTTIAHGDDLVQFNNLQYLGAFRVPDIQNKDDSLTFNYAHGALAYNPGSPGTLFIDCHVYSGYVAEISIPTPTNPSSIGGLNRANLLQSCSDSIAGGTIGLTGKQGVSRDGTYVGGLYVYDGKLITSLYIWYDASGSQTNAFFIKPNTNLSQANAVGAYQIGNAPDEGFIDGWMMRVPTTWQSVFKGSLISGNNPESIVSRSSWGPDAFAWDPNNLTDLSKPVPSTPLLYYSQDHATLGNWNGPGPVNNTTVYWENAGNGYHGAVIPDGTRSILFFGAQGTGPFCYGQATDDKSLAGTPVPGSGGEVIYCYDPTGGGGKGNTGYPYQLQIMAYDLNDLAAVAAGTKKPWELLPYGVWPLINPRLGLDGTSNRWAGGVAYDPVLKRIYVSAPNTDSVQQYSSLPVIHVWQVNTGTIADTAPPTAPTGLKVVAGDGNATLSWNINSESDLWGYNVYRGVSPSAVTSKQNSSLIVQPTYLQTGLTKGAVYWYAITAIDTSGNESAPSAPVSVTIPNSPAGPGGGTPPPVTNPSGVSQQDGQIFSDVTVNLKERTISPPFESDDAFSLYTVHGRFVRNLPGTATIDDFAGLAAGLYFYSNHSGSRRKLIVIK